MQLAGPALYSKARSIIPGGTQLLSKRPEMILPEYWPSYYQKAQGVYVWDLEGNRYIDMSHCGVGACVLGFADPDVNSAVRRAVDSGSMATLNCPEDVELAELLCELHPWAEMARYARSGGEAMTVAVRIARASTGRDKVAFCGYHGWHDWYLAANLAGEDALEEHLLPGLDPAGVPSGLQGSARPFRYNQFDELEAIVAECGKELAAIVVEPVRNREPAAGFLEQIRSTATEIGAVLILDEVSSGFRLATGGAHLRYNVDPDIAVFAKAISNGYPMAAVIGRPSVMQAAQDTFISSTYWTERIGPTAALATVRKHRREDVARHLIRVGALVQEGWRTVAKRFGLPVDVSGIAPMGHFTFECEHASGAHTLFTQEMLEHGFLANQSFYATYAHQVHHIANYLEAVEVVFRIVAQAVESNTVMDQLKGPVAHTGFRRLT